MPRYFHALTVTCAVGATLLTPVANADTGKLLLTGGVSSIDGAAGGGLTPWAVTGTHATDEEIGASAFATHVGTRNYGLNIVGAALGVKDRFEFSVARQDFDTQGTGTALGLPGLHLKQTILGAKAKIYGDAVLDSDTLMPQIAVGLEYKTLASSGLDGTLDALGAKRHGVDAYASATKLLLGQSVLLNATLRATQANQNGLLGYGATLGGRENNYSVQPELSAAYLLNKNVVVGAEYRFMRNKLQSAGNAAGLGNGLQASDWKDIFVVWAPSKNFSLTLAYVDLGVIVPAVAQKKQTGFYISAQFAL